MAVTRLKDEQIDGEVQGPASSTDNAIARYDSTTGKLIQNSNLTISDSAAGKTTLSVANTDTIAVDASDVLLNAGSAGLINLSINNSPYLTVNGGTGQVDTTTMNVAGNVNLSGNIVRSGDTNTTIQGTADQWNFVTGGSSRLTVNNSGVSVSNGDLDMNANNITDVGTVDGRDVSADGTRLDTITDANYLNSNTTKTQVGLGNVDNTSDATKNSAIATLTNKTIGGSQLVNNSVPTAKLDYTNGIVVATIATGQTTSGTTELAIGTITVPAQTTACYVNVSAFMTGYNNATADHYKMRIREGSGTAGTVLATCGHRHSGGVNERRNYAITCISDDASATSPYLLAAATSQVFTVTVTRISGSGVLQTEDAGSIQAIVYPYA